MVVRICNVRRSRVVVGVRKKKNAIDFVVKVAKSSSTGKRPVASDVYYYYYLSFILFDETVLAFFLLRENELVFFKHTHTHKYI